MDASTYISTLAAVHSSNERQLPGKKSDIGYAAILHGKNDLRFEPAPDLGELQAGMARVEIKATSICGSDLHLIKDVSRQSSALHPAALNRTLLLEFFQGELPWRCRDI